MKYYLIHENQIFIAENQNALSRYYSEAIKILPDDYNSEKYIVVDGELVLNPDYDEMLLERKRQEKYNENETVRDEFLLSGVIYKNVLFDSDIEQKLNISVTVTQMSDTDTINWVGKDGVTSLLCTKADLLAIGEMLIVMTNYVWAVKNPEIKLAIQNAKTIKELEDIEIIYKLDEMQDLLEENLEL